MGLRAALIPASDLIEIEKEILLFIGAINRLKKTRDIDEIRSACTSLIIIKVELIKICEGNRERLSALETSCNITETRLVALRAFLEINFRLLDRQREIIAAVNDIKNDLSPLFGLFHNLGGNRNKINAELSKL